jgi:AcrR family transcriptional regulator
MSRKPEASRIDKRAQRTRTLLSYALMELGVERGIDAIEVGDLADAAGVGRSTFYTHFASKEQFLTQSFVDMIAMMERRGAARLDRSELLPATELFAHFAEARAFVAEFSKSEEMPRMLAAGEAKLRAIVESNLERRAPDWTRERRRDAAIYIAAGFIGLSRWWMESGMKRSAEEMCAAFARLTQNALADD